MVHDGLVVHNGNEFKFAHPYIYVNNHWVYAIPQIYNGGAWEQSGASGCPMVYFLTADGEYLMDSNGQYFLVRDMPSDT